MLRGNMATKSTAGPTPLPADGPGTVTGRIIARLPDVEAWFRSGLKTKEVLARLKSDGINVHPITAVKIFARFGKNEQMVRRAMAMESLGHTVPTLAMPVAPQPAYVPAPMMQLPAVARKKAKATDTKPPKTAGKPAPVTEDLKRKDAKRVEFRPNPNPSKEELI